MTRWIVSPKYDLGFFILSAALTFVFYGIYRGAHHLGFVLRGDSILITYLLFTALFDHPHIFQTFSRTHADGEEFRNRRKLYTWGLAGFILAGAAATGAGLEAQLIVFASIFGTWHIIRQHAGFMKAYKVLNNDLDPIDNWLDGLTFYTAVFACFFNDYADLRGPIVIYKELRASFPSLPGDVGPILWSVFLGLLTLFGARQTWRVMTGRAINWPKILLMAAAVTTHYFVFFATATPFLVAEALETVYHDVQYQGWIMHYQRKRFPHVSRVALKWFGAAMLYGAAVGAVEILGLLRHGWAVWVFVPFTMAVIFHYYVDGLIWKFRDYPELRKLLLPGNQESGIRKPEEASPAPAAPS